MKDTSRPDDRGFTLLEILVALVVFGLLMAGLAGGVRLGIGAWGVQDRALAGLDGLEPLDRGLGRLIEAADPGSPDGRGSLHGDPGKLRFVVPAALLGRQTLMTDRLDIGIGVNKAGELILRSEPHIHATPLRPAPHDIDETILIDRVSAIEFSYFDDQAGKWSKDWDHNALPALIRLHITRKGEAQAWPDLVWAPMRERSD